jgi:hypothetical protein
MTILTKFGMGHQILAKLPNTKFCSHYVDHKLFNADTYKDVDMQLSAANTQKTSYVIMG